MKIKGDPLLNIRSHYYGNYEFEVMFEESVPENGTSFKIKARQTHSAKSYGGAGAHFYLNTEGVTRLRLRRGRQGQASHLLFINVRIVLV